MKDKTSKSKTKSKKAAQKSKINRSVRDMYSNIITAGDYISYPGRQGSDTYMRTAKVLDVAERNLAGESAKTVLRVAVAMAPRYAARKSNPDWQTKIVRTTVSEFHRAVIVPKSYVQNDKRYMCLLEV